MVSLPTPGALTTAVTEKTVDPPVFRRHPRARRLRLRVDPATGQAVITLPPRTTRAEALRFFAIHQGWLEARRAALGEARPFAPGHTFDLFGTPTRLRHDPTHRGRPQWADGALTVGGREPFFPRRVRDFIREESARRFHTLAATYAQQLGVRITRIALRDTASRWGSCTATGRISLSWRLAFAPHNVACYVIAHEVAHLRELNHSPAFWNLVTQLVGDFRKEKNWLTRHGPSLLRLGVAVV